MDFWTLLIILFFVVYPVGTFFYRRAKRRYMDEQWQTAAQELGMHFYRKSSEWERRIGGKVDGLAVSARMVNEGDSRDLEHVTEYAVHLKDELPADLDLKSKTFRATIAKFFGAKEVDVGDEEFSADIVVKGTRASVAREYLTPARRARIRRAFASYPDLRIEGGSVYRRRREAVEDSGDVVSDIRELMHFARSLRTADSNDDVLDKAVESERRGLLAEALSLLQARREQLEHGAANEIQANDVEETVLEANLLYLADRSDEAKQAYARALQLSPEDQEIKGWTTHISIPPERATTSERTEPDVVTLCDTVFDPKISSFETSQRFEEKFEGRVVRWTGTLKSAAIYSYDFLFGTGPGTRATFEIHTIQINTYSDRKVLAVVQLPEDAAKTLAGLTGQTIKFAGTLHKVDAYMKNLFPDRRLPPLSQGGEHWEVKSASKCGPGNLFPFRISRRVVGVGHRSVPRRASSRHVRHERLEGTSMHR